MLSLYGVMLLAVFIVPFVYGLIHRKWLRAYGFFVMLRTVAVSALPFICLDIIAVRFGWWSFSVAGSASIRLLGLPIEEILFFFVIPFSCMFIWLFVRRGNALTDARRIVGHHFMRDDT